MTAIPTENDTVVVRTCAWFVTCSQQTTREAPHPVLGWLPICDRCAGVVGKQDGTRPIRRCPAGHRLDEAGACAGGCDTATPAGSDEHADCDGATMTDHGWIDTETQGSVSIDASAMLVRVQTIDGRLMSPAGALAVLTVDEARRLRDQLTCAIHRATEHGDG